MYRIFNRPTLVFQKFSYTIIICVSVSIDGIFKGLSPFAPSSCLPSIFKHYFESKFAHLCDVLQECCLDPLEVDQVRSLKQIKLV